MNLKISPGGQRTYLLLLGLITVAYLFVERFPGAYNPIAVGLDPSWRYGLNYLEHSTRLFGRDVVCTYGPLGYLLNPVNIRSNVVRALSVRLLIHGVLIGTLLYYLFKRNKVLSVIVFVAAYWIASNSGLGFSEDEFEYSLVIATCLLTCISALEDTRSALIADILNGILAASFLFMKFNIGLTALTVVGISLTVRLLRRKQGTWQHAFVTGVAYLSTTIVIGAIYFKTPGNVVVWVRRSLDIVDDYSVAMSIIGPPGFLYQALIALAIVFSLLFVLYRRQSQSLHIALGLSMAMFFCFKQGFVRQDGHMLLFYPFLLAAIAVLVLNSENWHELTLGSSSFLIVLALSIPVSNEFSLLSASRIKDKLLASEGLRNIEYLFYLNDVRAELNRQSYVNLKSERLPDEWLNLIKANNSSVSPIPWELSYCAINNLHCAPFPTLQMYVAYNSSLDRWSALQYRGSQAPEFILMDFIDFDGRNMMLDAPATWRAIFQGYEIVRKQSLQGVHLLQKKTPAPDEELAEVGKGQVEIDKWIGVPPSNGLLYAFIDMRLSGVGWLSKAVFRIPPVWVTFMDSGGGVKQYRMIPGSASDGLLVNFSPGNMEQLDGLFSHATLDRVVRFRISGPGASYYNKVNTLVWREDRRHEMPFVREDNISLNGLKPAPEQTDAYIDTVNTNSYPFQAPVAIDFNAQNVVTVSGWALDKRAHKVAGGVFVTIDGRIDIPATSKRDRPDVADVFKNGDYRLAGFSASILVERLGRGRHTLSLKILTADKKGYYESSQKVALAVR